MKYTDRKITTEKNMTCRSLLLVCLVAAAGYPETDTRARLDSLQQRVEEVVSKAGIHFGGEFRSQFLLSRIRGEGVTPGKRTDESVEYTSVDFDITARPNDAIGARVMFRMHQDWRNFFSDIANPIFSRWISIDGSVARMFSYHAGDFKERYSPLTLYSPDITVPFEPEIFAQLRRQAMAEEFVRGNSRPLQGASVNLDAEVVPILKELHVNLLASRLRLAQTNIENGSMVATELEKAPMDRYALGANTDAVVLPDLFVGGTAMDIFDLKATADTSDTVADTLAKQTAVWAVRGGAGTRAFLDTDRFSLSLSAELAQSRNDSSWYRVDTLRTAGDTSTTHHLLQQTITGNACSIDLRGRLGFGNGSLRFGVGYLSNDRTFRNELAQSPTFIGQRIMNIENDSTYRDNTFKWFEPSRFVATHYSTFDAMYRHVFKFTPSEATNLWHKAPMRKISYTRAILSQEELDKIADEYLDPALQLVMPFGPATPNRSGFRGSLDLSLLEGGLDVRGSLLMVDEKESSSIVHPVSVAYDSGETMSSGTAAPADTTVMENTEISVPATSFLQAGGGVSVDLSALITALPHPLVLSGGYRLSRAINDGNIDYDVTASTTEVGFLNAGLAWTFWKRATLLAGYQRIDMSADGTVDDIVTRQVQTHWAVGARYRVGEGGTLTGALGKVAVAWPENPPAGHRDFSQWQPELRLTVSF